VNSAYLFIEPARKLQQWGQYGQSEYIKEPSQVVLEIAYIDLPEYFSAEGEQLIVNIARQITILDLFGGRRDCAAPVSKFILEIDFEMI
jgi:hypothetical protein